VVALILAPVLTGGEEGQRGNAKSANLGSSRNVPRQRYWRLFPREGIVQPNEVAVWTFAAIGVGALLWYAYSMQDDNAYVPETQGELQVMGLGVQAGMRVNAGTPLDLSHEIHGWHPGYDPDPSAQPVTQSRHRYPALPGGNISTVMHKGWSAACNDAPAGNDWRLNPPEAAVL
jgi:hypothetical protein